MGSHLPDVNFLMAVRVVSRNTGLFAIHVFTNTSGDDCFARIGARNGRPTSAREASPNKQCERVLHCTLYACTPSVCSTDSFNTAWTSSMLNADCKHVRPQTQPCDTPRLRGGQCAGELTSYQGKRAHGARCRLHRNPRPPCLPRSANEYSFSAVNGPFFFYLLGD